MPTEKMFLTNALTIVLDLASHNALNEFDPCYDKSMDDERLRQEKAIDFVRHFLFNLKL